MIVEDCPKFTITPTMPAASDPREFTTPNGKANFRFDTEWGGKLPVSVGLIATGGGGAVQPGFAFNPVRMLNNKVNIIMDVITNNAGKGDYPITVTATINDPELPRECSRATTNVVLVVGESRPQDFSLQPRPDTPQPLPNNPPQPRPVQIAPIKIADQQGNVTVKGNLVKTGNDGKTKIPLGNTTLDINSNTKVWRLNWDDIIDDNISDLIADDLSRRPPVLLEIIYKELKAFWEDIKFEIKSTWRDIGERATRSIDCFYASGREIVNPCSDRKTWYLEGGDVHYFGRRSGLVVYPVDTSDVFVTPDAVMVPSGTEFVLSLDKNGNTKLTVLEGSVLYIQLSTKQVMLLNATQQLAVPVQPAGGDKVVSNRITSVELGNLDQWWIQSDRLRVSNPSPQLGAEPSKPESPRANASPSGIGDEMTGTILGTLIVFLAVTGAFLGPSRKQRTGPEMLEARKSTLRPRKIALLGLFLIFGPGFVVVPISLTRSLGIPENLLYGTWAVPLIVGFILLVVAPIKLIIDKQERNYPDLY